MGRCWTAERSFPKRTCARLLRRRERGIEILLVTGRRFDFARTVSDLIPCDLHLIVSNGALIKSKSGETHQRLLLPAEDGAKSG